MRYFLSYVYTYDGLGGCPHFGCCVSEGEHPVAKVARWNREIEGRTTVLLWWAEVGPETPEIDRES